MTTVPESTSSETKSQSTNASRVVHQEDALAWLERSPVLEGASLVASLPDRSEFPCLSLTEWIRWFTDSAALALSRVPENGVGIFYQSDIKVDGRWIDKGYLVQKAAEAAGVPLVWHKLVLRKPAGTVTFGRAAFSHLLCFSRGVRADLSRATADVLPEAGASTWTRGMGRAVCETICRFVRLETDTRTIVAPFCGQGQLLAVAERHGLSSIGIELSAKQARRARSATVVDLP